MGNNPENNVKQAVLTKCNVTLWSMTAVNFFIVLADRNVLSAARSGGHY